jgi:hypothetical protein
MTRDGIGRRADGTDTGTRAAGRRTATADDATRPPGAGRAGFFAAGFGLGRLATEVAWETRLVVRDCVVRDAARTWLFGIGRSLTFGKRVQGMHTVVRPADPRRPDHG